MKILAFDTSSGTLSVALTEKGHVLAESEKAVERGHSSVLVPEIARVLSRAGCSWSDVDCVAAGLGPGSFTGLRVGLATAKLLAWSQGKKLIGVPSLEAVAVGRKDGARKIAVLLDAKRGNFYAAFYERVNGRMKEKRKAAVLKPAEIARRTDASTETVIVAGGVHPRARHIAAVAERLAHARKFTNPFRIEPLYLHPKDCNTTRKSVEMKSGR